MKYIIDRIESGYAVCQRYGAEEMIYIPVRNLPGAAREGSLLDVGKKVELLPVNEEDQEAIRRKLDGLWEK
jgi:hypothetical protein